MVNLCSDTPSVFNRARRISSVWDASISRGTRGRAGAFGRTVRGHVFRMRNAFYTVEEAAVKKSVRAVAWEAACAEETHKPGRSSKRMP